MSKHEHQWVLVDSYDSWHKPKTPKPAQITVVNNRGLFGGSSYISSGRGLQSIREDIIETILSGDDPHITSYTWVCDCGKRKTNFDQQPSLHASLGLSQRLSTAVSQDKSSKNANGKETQG